jgi:Gas vesicle synthesis protein GvpL/GvpF
VIHVYGFVPAPPPLLQVEGLGGAQIETHASGPVATLLSRHPDGPPATEEAVLRHAQVVDEALRAAGTVLPARFGTVYPDEAALARAVAPRADSLVRRLASVRGCVELGVRVLSSELGEDDSVESGLEYMRSRLRQTEDRRRLAAEVHGALDELSRESTHRIPNSGNVVFVASYLVPGEARQLFERRVDELGRDRAALVCTGPWPPYSFAEAS